MWCSRCQQDIPAIAQAGTGTVVCARCQLGIKTSAPPDESPDYGHERPLEDGPGDTVQDPLATLSDWQTEQRFRHLARTLRVGAGQSHGTWRESHRLDPPHDLSADQSPIEVKSTSVRRSPATHYLGPRRSTGGQVLSWLILLCGLLAFGCGLAISSWSFTEDIPLYWEAGLAMTLAGQGLLITGLILVLSRLWRSSRYANHKLNEIHWQLGEVQRTAQAIVGMRQENAPAFYAELARGASPQMLLASLRGQLDQLNLRVNGEGR